MRMQQNLRENRELFLELKGVCPDNRIPTGLLLSSKDKIVDAVAQFKKALEQDADNEKLPQK